jgi:hypothetical protein
VNLVVSIPVGRMAGLGAALSFPRVLAKVPSPSDLPAFVIVDCQPWFVAFTTLCSGQARLRASWMEARATKARLPQSALAIPSLLGFSILI